MDGADWEQTFLDVHRPDTVRILDFPHAVEYLTKAAQATWCVDGAVADTWVQQQAHILKHDEHGPTKVLKALAHLPVDQATDRATARQARDTALNYLTKRLDQIQYATFQAQGLPIGSGSVESANKLVVETRLKGSGMHWARPHVNPLVALRTIACSARWAEAWPQIERYLREHARHLRTRRQRERRTAARAAACRARCPLQARYPCLRESRLLFGLGAASIAAQLPITRGRKILYYPAADERLPLSQNPDGHPSSVRPG